MNDSRGHSVGPTRIYIVSYQSPFPVSVVTENLATWPMKGDKGYFRRTICLQEANIFWQDIQNIWSTETQTMPLGDIFNPDLPQYFVLSRALQLFMTGRVYFQQSQNRLAPSGMKKKNRPIPSTIVVCSSRLSRVEEPLFVSCVDWLFPQASLIVFMHTERALRQQSYE